MLSTLSDLVARHASSIALGIALWWLLGMFAFWAQFRMDGTPSDRASGAIYRRGYRVRWTHGDIAIMVFFGFVCGAAYLVITGAIFLAWIIRPGTRLGAWVEKSPALSRFL